MKITKGLDIPISGEPVQTLGPRIDKNSPSISTVAVLGRDFHGIKPSLKVKVGDHVKMGQTLYTCKKTPGINFTARGAGTITNIHRGAKRALQSITIALDEKEEAVQFQKYTVNELSSLSREQVRQQLQESGVWTAFRTRPYSKIPNVDDVPTHIFVTAIDTNPLAADPLPIIRYYEDDFVNGLEILTKLTDGDVKVCHQTGATLPESTHQKVTYHDFDGPHPAGLPGTHIHMLSPVGETKTVWHLNYQDVVAISRLFLTGEVFQERIIALSGPMVKQPRMIKTRIGASTNELLRCELVPGDVRVISGSVLDGYRCAGWSAYLGRFNLQVSVIAEGEPRKMFHWLNPFIHKFSIAKVFAHSHNRTKKFAMSSTQNGSPRAMVPLGHYESVMPLDILPTQLLRALLVRDTETAKMLGALELDETDLALCTFVCHSKYEYGAALRETLTMIERDG